MHAPETAHDDLPRLQDRIVEGCLTVDTAGRVLRVNAAALAIFNRPADQLIGRPVAKLFPQAAPGVIAALIEGRDDEVPLRAAAVLPEETPPAFRLETVLVPEGRAILIHDLRERNRRDGELAQLKATMAVSQQLLRHKNNELDRSLAEMERMNRKLSELDELKSQFLSNVSHELRTPLNAILGSLQLVREGLCESREEEEEYIGAALEAARNLLAIINEMLDNAKLVAGKMNLLIEDHRVHDLFEEIYSMMSPAARQKGLTLFCELPADAPHLAVRADFQKARQILLCIVGNAVKFSSRGEIRVRAAIDAEAQGLVRFSVSDEGIGIEPEHQAAVFDAFVQVDSSATRQHQGVGLGLAVARHLVEMMGGTIGIHSEGRGKGTCIEFTLPAAFDASGEASGRADADHLPLTF